MDQKFYVIFIILVAVGSFLYFRNKDKDFTGRDKMLFFIGLFSLAIGIIIVHSLYGFNILIECLLLHTRLVSGKLILIGYIFILMSFLFFAEKLINRFFNNFVKKK